MAEKEIGFTVPLCERPKENGHVGLLILKHLCGPFDGREGVSLRRIRLEAE